MTDKPDEREERNCKHCGHHWKPLRNGKRCPNCQRPWPPLDGDGSDPTNDDTAEQAPKAREWWIVPNEIHHPHVMQVCDQRPANPDHVHVIEKSAYDEMKSWGDSVKIKYVECEKQRDACETKLAMVLANNGKLLTERDAALAELEDVKATMEKLDIANDNLLTQRSELRAEREVLRTENEMLKETISYLPKPPTEPYEKAMAKEILKLREALEKIVHTNDHESCDEYQLADIARKALEQSE